MDNPRKIRIVLCRGQYCNLGRRADTLLKRLEPILDEANGDRYPRLVKLEIASCLSMCGAGPNLAIYPAAVTFSHVDEATLICIMRDHVLSAFDDDVSGQTT